jgi:uncharacterized protein YjbI with pentapeptide repeats
MDEHAFDRMTRLFGAHRSRRGAMGTLLGVAALGAAETAGAKRRGKGRSARKRAQAEALAGYRNCPLSSIGPGKNLSGCDFFDRDLRGKNFSATNSSRSTFAGANLCGVPLRAANLGNTTFASANLTRADLRGTNLSTANTTGAVFCQTRMPNGTLNNADCPAQPCCSDAECGANTVCTDAGCVCPSGSQCCANSDCQPEQCKIAACTGNQCTYTNAPDGTKCAFGLGVCAAGHCFIIG